jgi:hypothetical protein
MNLDVGRLCAREVVQLGSLTIIALFLGTLGAFLVYLVLPGQFGTWAGWRVLLALFGGGVAFLGYGLSLTIARLLYRDWTSYHERLAEWHAAAIESYEQSGGVQVETSITEWELSASRPLHVLAVALAIQARAQSGEQNPHSVRAIEGACWLGHLRLGDVTPSQAEHMGRALADLGLVRGRAPRRAGEWVPSGTDEILARFQRNWSKVGQGYPYHEEV